MRFGREKTYKVCPRCGNKCLLSQQKCEECELIFSRLEFASNKAAKKKILHFDNDFIIYTNQYPKDMSYLKLLLYTIFFGIFGGHYYYVGKYLKGILMTLTFVFLIFCTIFNEQISAVMEAYYLYAPIGVAALAWIISLSYVILKKFKVPVIVDMSLPVEDKKANKKHKKSGEKV